MVIKWYEVSILLVRWVGEYGYSIENMLKSYMVVYLDDTTVKRVIFGGISKQKVERSFNSINCGILLDIFECEGSCNDCTYR